MIKVLPIKKNSKAQIPSELRLDLVSNDWVVIATGRARRPESFAEQERNKTVVSPEECPFCQPNLLDQAVARINKPDGSWMIVSIPNKFPAFSKWGDVLTSALNERKDGPYRILDGYGFHEVVITYDHKKSIAELPLEAVKGVVDLYHSRFLDLAKQPFIKYVSIFHNHGQEAGASVAHPHSQIIAIPIIDPDLRRSLDGAESFYRAHGECVYCTMIKWDIKDGQRIIYENEKFVALCPFAPQISFEVRIYPKEHQSSFGRITDREKELFADVLKKTLSKIYRGLNDPAYNFYIHTMPMFGDGDYGHYHWHLNILPKTGVWAGFELGFGIEISTVVPEEAAKYLRKF